MPASIEACPDSGWSTAPGAPLRGTSLPAADLWSMAGSAAHRDSQNVACARRGFDAPERIRWICRDRHAPASMPSTRATWLALRRASRPGVLLDNRGCPYRILLFFGFDIRDWVCGEREGPPDAVIAYAGRCAFECGAMATRSKGHMSGRSYRGSQLTSVRSHLLAEGTSQWFSPTTTSEQAPVSPAATTARLAFLHTAG
jgi:hypothetical protein